MKVAEHIKTLRDDGRPYLSQSVSSKFIRLLPGYDGNKIQLEKEVTIIDTVTLEGLEVGYTVQNWYQMLKKKMPSFLSMGNGKVITLFYC